MTGHHRGLKRKLWAGYRVTITTMHVISTGSALLLGQFYFSSSSVVLHAFYVICVHYASTTIVPNFVSVVPRTTEVATKKNYSITHSLTHSPSLFDSPGTEAFASGKNFQCHALASLMALITST